MAHWKVFQFLLLGGSAFPFVAITGCGATVNQDPIQIQLAIYTPDCVDVQDASTAAGAHVQIYACGAGKMSQEWELHGLSGGQAEVVNENSKMCMAVANDPDTAPGQYVVQEPCSTDGSDPTQLWTMPKAPSGEAGMRFVSAASGQCLDLPYGAVASIDTLQQYTCDSDDPAQGWTLNEVALGNTP
jgi:hypothetical protein